VWGRCDKDDVTRSVLGKIAQEFMTLMFNSSVGIAWASRDVCLVDDDQIGSIAIKSGAQSKQVLGAEVFSQNHPLDHFAGDRIADTFSYVAFDGYLDRGEIWRWERRGGGTSGRRVRGAAWSFAAVLGDLSFCSGAPPAESKTMPRTLSIANAVTIRLRRGMFKPSSFVAR
jgi:hypothetical protein